MKQFEKRFGEWVVRYRWWIIAASVVVLLAAVNGTKRLTISADNRAFFGEDNPHLQALDALENTFSRSNTVFFTVAPRDGNVFTTHTLAAVEALTETSWQMPYSSRVSSITNFQHTKVDGDELVVEDLVSKAADLEALELEAIRKTALDEPELVNNLVSASGHVTGVSVNLILPGKSPTEVAEVAAFARAMAEEMRNEHAGIDLYLTGSVMSDNAFGEAGMKDMSTLLPLMFLVLVVVAGIALRSVVATVNTLIIIFMSMATGMGLAGWLGLAITPASANAPTIILGLAVADSIHILTTIVQQMRRGRSKREAVAESLRVNLQPVFLTSVTTAIGFLTMNFSDAPPFRDLGNIVAMGVMAALVYSVLFLPALTAVLPLRVKAKETTPRHSVLERLADFVINRRKALFWSTVATSLVLTFGIARIDLQDDWMKYFDKSYDIRTATDFTEENLTGFNAIEYSLESGESGGISNPEYLAKVEQFGDWLRRQPKVSHVSSITNTMKRLNLTMHADDEGFYRLPDERDLAAQYLLLYEMSLPFGFDLNDQINIDKSATRLVVRLSDITTTELRAMEEKAKKWLAINSSPEFNGTGSGLSLMWAHIARRNINNMLGAAFGALVLISMILIIALRSTKLGLLSLIPNLAPAFIGFGIWGLVVG